MHNNANISTPSNGNIATPKLATVLLSLLTTRCNFTKNLLYMQTTFRTSP
jgi:hypothetical protein